MVGYVEPLGIAQFTGTALEHLGGGFVWIYQPDVEHTGVGTVLLNFETTFSVNPNPHDYSLCRVSLEALSQRHFLSQVLVASPR